MKKIFFLSVFFLLFFVQGFATHNRAGEITYELLNCSTRTFRITITTYIKLCPVCPDRDFLDSVHSGDLTQSQFARFYLVNLGDSIRKTRYICDHSYEVNDNFVINLTYS